MRRIIPGVVGIGLILILTGCQSISYKPALSLDESPRTIKAKAKIETFVDKSPPRDKSRKFGGWSAVEPKTLAGDLAIEVTNAVLTDFSNNQVFEVIKKRIDDPDLLVKGKIRRFYGKSGPNAAFWITIPIDIIWFFGIPVMSEKGMVDMGISIHRPDGTLLGKYSGEAEFSSLYNIYSHRGLAIGTSLNRAFDESIKEIRQQILADEAKFY